MKILLKKKEPYKKLITTGDYSHAVGDGAQVIGYYSTGSQDLMSPEETTEFYLKHIHKKFYEPFIIKGIRGVYFVHFTGLLYRFNFVHKTWDKDTSYTNIKNLCDTKEKIRIRKDLITKIIIKFVSFYKTYENFLV